MGKGIPLGHKLRDRVVEQISEEVRLMSRVPKGSVLVPLLFPAHINDECIDISGQEN
jgi:hypothetical protein